MLSDEFTRSETVPAALVPQIMSEQLTDDSSNINHWTAWTFRPEYSTLFERRAPNAPGSHHAWKSWQHYKCSAPPVAGGSTAIVSVNPLYQNKYNAVVRPTEPYSLYNSSFGAPGYLNNNLMPLYSPAADGNFVSPPGDLSSLINSALRSMLPLIRAELSTINSTIELKDFESVPRTIKGILRLPKGLLRKGRSFLKIVEILRVAADVYLQQKFNISPLISDVQGVYSALAKTEKRINALVSRAGKLQNKHFRCSLTDMPDSQDVETGKRVFGYRLGINDGDLTSNAIATNERTVVSEPSQFHAQLQYNYHYTQYQLEHARVLALLDAFGVNLNPQIIWNAIPWSFVVDWLVDVGQWLGTTRVGNMDPKINITQFLWSTRRSRRITVTSRITSAKYYAGYDPFGPSYPPEGITHPVVTETAYRRDAGVPTVSSLTTSGLNPTEFSLGAALVITRRRHRPKRRK